MRTPDRFQLQRWGWEAFLTILVTFMVSYTWMYSDISVPNERSRLYLAVALVDGGTVQIDKQLKRWGKIYDLAERDGHYYSDKAPGSSFLGAAVYWVATRFKAPLEWTIGDLINLMRTWLMIPFTMIGFLFLRRILNFLGLDPPVIDVVSLAWALGTAAFHYGGAYFGHQIVAVSLLVSLYCLLRAEEYTAGSTSTMSKWALAAGAAAGVAGVTEYQAGIVCVLLVVYVFFADSRMRYNGIPAMLVGAAPFVALLFWYNDTAFGAPWELSYHYLADKGLQEIHSQGIAGVTVPKWEYFSGSMFSLHRGLLTTSPLFLMAFWGLWQMWEEGHERLALFIGATLLYFIAFVSSSNMWFAGWGFGPRLLVPGMALWSIAVGFGFQAAFAYPISEAFAKGLAVLQIAWYQAVNVYFPEPPDTSHNPILDIVPVMREANVAAPNLGQKLFGMDPNTSVTLLGYLTLLVVAIIVLRGMRILKWSSRVAVVGGVVATLMIGATIISAVGPSQKWDEVKGEKWVKLVKRWEARER